MIRRLLGQELLSFYSNKGLLTEAETIDKGGGETRKRRTERIRQWMADGGHFLWKVLVLK